MTRSVTRAELWISTRFNRQQSADTPLTFLATRPRNTTRQDADRREHYVLEHLRCSGRFRHSVFSGRSAMPRPVLTRSSHSVPGKSFRGGDIFTSLLDSLVWSAS